MTFGSLFAGIGGFDLGFERAGLKCRWQVEIDPYCQKVLAKHWPDVGRWDDVRTFPPAPAEDWYVDVICGGFPCQDISYAGLAAGLDGEQSKLWFEYLRVFRILRPRIIVVENVAALTSRGIDRVLGNMAESGYDAEWDCFPASAFGFTHIRDRVFILGHRRDADSSKPRARNLLANSREGSRLVQLAFGRPDSTWVAARREAVAGERNRTSHDERHTAFTRFAPLRAEPNMGRVVHGVPGRLDRVEHLGNSVVPEIAEWIGRRIVACQS